MTPKQRLGRALPDETFRRLKYRQVHGVWPSLRDPRRYSEKVNWRILRDRRDVLAWTCDKLAMKAEVARRRPDIRVPRTYWVGTDLAELTSAALPDRWVLKPNASSGRVFLGSGPVDAATLTHLRSLTADWLDARELLRLREWAYSRARPVLLVEEFIGRDEMPPPDYKVFVFDGVPQVILFVRGRFAVKQRTFLRADWTHIPVTNIGPPEPDLPRPPDLDRLLQAAADLGRGFDHIRVDLYDVDGEIWFGEYTPYSWSGFDRILPVEVDLAWGAHWRLPKLDRQGR